MSSKRREFVLDQYERLWEAVYEKALAKIEAGELDLSRLHLSMRRNFGEEFSDPHLARKYREHERAKVSTGFLYDRQLIQVHDADSRVISLMTDAVKMRAAIDAMGPDVERIVELGSGWGKVLFNLWLYGAPSEAEFWAFELTNAGRKTTELVAERLAPGLKIRTRPFDYYEPDFSSLSPELITGLITHHSLEQIPQIEPGFVNALLKIPGFRTCVHLEPCGFQIPAGNWLRNRSAEFMTKVDADAQRFAAKRNQNMNLYPLLREFEERGDIRIHTVRKNLCSHLLANPTTLIVWSPADQEPAGLGRCIRDDLQPALRVRPVEAPGAEGGEPADTRLPLERLFGVLDFVWSPEQARDLPPEEEVVEDSPPLEEAPAEKKRAPPPSGWDRLKARASRIRRRFRRE